MIRYGVKQITQLDMSAFTYNGYTKTKRGWEVFCPGFNTTDINAAFKEIDWANKMDPKTIYIVEERQ